ncbi:MAG: methylated-DNA--[protein]-cysteine S-methyltransferase [Cyanobacteriota bacterium]|nr:methylated-DNA--[protein]-cysteine S-methyltransferase [Cyanobacteriota bacterium]
MNTVKYSKYLYKSPIGYLTFCIENDFALVGLKPAQSDFIQDSGTPFSNKIKQELEEYFSYERKYFDINIKFYGTDFQKSVWSELLKISYGKTETYGQIAQNIGNVNYSRAVGNACNKNPVMIIVPCHRVVSSNGKQGGYAYGAKIKSYLLNLESK